MLLKETWWSKDPNRYAHGKKLRDAFLTTYISNMKPIKSSNKNKNQSRSTENKDMLFCLPNAKQARTLKPPEFRHLPFLDLTKYIQAEEITKARRIKTKHDDEILKNQHTNNIADSQKRYYNYLDKLIKSIDEQFQRYVKFSNKIKENCQQRKTLVDMIYESRKLYTDSLLTDRTRAKERKTKRD